MRKKRPTEEAILNKVSLWDVFAAVGIVGMQIVEHIQFADRDYEDKTLDQLAKTLDTQLNVMAATCMEYESLFRLAMTELPPGFAGIKTINPLYHGDVTKPSHDDDGNVSDLGDRLPF